MPPALSLAGRKVGRAELEEILKCLEFFLMFVKGRIWFINVNLLNFAWRSLDWMAVGTSID